jgi:hypothetical protein
MIIVSRTGKSRACIVGLIACFCSLTASAATTTYTSQSTWLAAVDNVTVEQFIVPFNQSAQFLSLGYSIDDGSVSVAGSSDSSWGGSAQGAINITFNTPGTTTPATVSAVLVLPNNEGTTRIRAFDTSGNELAMVDQFSGIRPYTDTDYAGFTSTEGIARLELDLTNVGNVLIEEIYFGDLIPVVPEPTAISLLACGIAGIVLTRRSP